MNQEKPRKLLIVESPAKARTIKKYLGSKFTVKASVGHVRDLPVRELGVDVESGFAPKYVLAEGKKEVISDLKKAAKNATEIYLGPDPDREGEAIAWHIREVLKDKKGTKTFYRVLFHEITKEAVKEALAKPEPLNQARFESQQARRVLDRLVGYNVSPLLWDKVKRGLSAGRVQSVALRIIVDREREIQAFTPEEYWSLTARLTGENPPPFEAKLVRIGSRKAPLKDSESTQAVKEEAERLPWSVAKVSERQVKSHPSPPFITSTLQQEAFNRLGYTAARTMALAQQLYEGVDVGDLGAIGLITYMRTDSTRVAPQAQAQARQYIASVFGEKYLPPKPPHYKSPKRAQEAHEAIRPTSIARPPEEVQRYLKPDLAALYRLIWQRFTASQMAPALVDQKSVDVAAGHYTFRATGSTVRFEGFRKVYGPTDKDNGELPDLKEGQGLKLLGLDPKQHFTQPPPRYTDASLVKTLEEKGIGRPSTYASILSTIQNKEYVLREKNRFMPTELGMVVTDLLVGSFPELLDDDFTARMENNLDQIEDGAAGWQQTLADFYQPFSQTLIKAKSSMADLKKQGLPTDLTCPACGAPMVIRLGRNGQFLACSNYPDCKTTSNFTRDDSGRVIPESPREVSETCPKCGKPMVARSGRFGPFLACSAYPECKTTLKVTGEGKEAPPDTPTQEVCDKCGAAMVIKTSRTGNRFLACSAYPKCRNAKSLPTGVGCPKEGCEGQLVERRSRRGKSFYGCSKYPDCDYVLWQQPVNKACPQCGHPLLVRKMLKAGPTLACPVKGCAHKEAAED